MQNKKAEVKALLLENQLIGNFDSLTYKQKVEKLSKLSGWSETKIKKQGINNAIAEFKKSLRL